MATSNKNEPKNPKPPTSEVDVTENVGPIEQETYTKGYKDMQKGERDMVKAGEKLSKAVSTGISEYLERRDKSAKNKKDGMMVDLFINFSKGFSEGLSEGAPAFGDMAEAMDQMVNTKKNRKRMRRQIKAMSRMMPPMPFMR